MIFWVELLPKLQALVTELAVLGTDPLWLEQGAAWSNQTQMAVASDTAVSIDLRVTSSQDGEWETRYEPYTDPDTGVVSDRALFTGQREFVLNIQCKAHQSDFDHWALTYAERIRTRLQFAPMLDRVQDDLGMCFWKYGQVNHVDGVEDMQATTIANLDLFGRVGFQDDPTAAQLVPLFASIQVRSKLAGYVPGAPPNFDDTISVPATPETNP